MVVRIRLRRIGQKNDPFWQVVAVDARKARDAKPLEIVGHYDPNPATTFKEKLLRLNFERVKYWLSVGAQPSETVSRLLTIAQVVPPKPPRSGLITQYSKTKAAVPLGTPRPSVMNLVTGRVTLKTPTTPSA
eukprot:GILI01005670.1.p1 GENE.GILI01005670.1~~GILI01005670.1.p1  ORF type:complete len:132 (+),score=21.44 GILI01005670.1:46-441(+)